MQNKKTKKNQIFPDLCEKSATPEKHQKLKNQKRIKSADKIRIINQFKLT